MQYTQLNTHRKCIIIIISPTLLLIVSDPTGSLVGGLGSAVSSRKSVSPSARKSSPNASNSTKNKPM